MFQWWKSLPGGIWVVFLHNWQNRRAEAEGICSQALDLRFIKGPAGPSAGVEFESA